MCTRDVASAGVLYVVDARTGDLEVAAALLLALDGLEEGLEVALAEAERAVPLDQLEEHGRPVLHRLSKEGDVLGEP